jgi:Tfp pilus assembly protein PilO
MTRSDTRSITIIGLVGLALLAALWMLAISPKRDDRATVLDTVSAQEQLLQTSRTQISAYENARRQFPGMLAELLTIDKAVPAQAAISSLLREVQRRAKAEHSELRLVALRGASAVAGAGSATTPLAPGATVGPDGLSALPFTFEFSGTYFDLRNILQTVRRSVSFRSGDLKAVGRLLTIDGLTLDRSKPTSVQTKAVVTATAYIAPDASASSQLPAPAATATATGGS